MLNVNFQTVLVVFAILFLTSTTQCQNRYSLVFGWNFGLPLGTSADPMGFSHGLSLLGAYETKNKLKLNSGLQFTLQGVTILKGFEFGRLENTRLNIPLFVSYQFFEKNKFRSYMSGGFDWNIGLNSLFFKEIRFENIILETSKVENKFYFNYSTRLGLNFEYNYSKSSSFGFFIHYILPLRNTDYLYYTIKDYSDRSTYKITRNYINLSYHGIQIGANFVLNLKKAKT